VLERVYDSLLNHLIAEGGHVVSKDEADQIASVLWDNGALNTAAVVKQPQVLAQMSGFSIPDDRKFMIVPYDGVGPEHPFSGEKLSAVMALYKVADIHEAVALTNAIQEYQGMGHSCGIYSNSDDNILLLAKGTKTSRVMVNQPQAASNSGNLWNGMRQTFSLGCGSWGGNSTNENINWRHLVNVTWVSKPLKEAKVLPSDHELFGQVIVTLG